HFLPKEIQIKISSITWMQRLFLTREINQPSIIKKLYGDKIQLPAAINALTFFLHRVLKKIRQNIYK
ncbi:MAG: hypothetical protein ACRCXR_08480, partial [Weissella cibaria]